MAPALAGRLATLHSSAIRDLLTVTARSDIISLAGGLPDPQLVPRDRIRTAADRALADVGSVQYTETPGWAGLRDVLAERETARIGRDTDRDRIVVTHGSQQALSLLAQVLVDPGATVVVEDPAYVGALQVFRAAEANIERVPLDRDGMVVDALEELLVGGLRPAVVHTVANFHNPRSVTMSSARRQRLAELAEQYDFWVVEDDPYGELWFTTAPPEPVAAWSDHVIRLSSASKIVAPSLRTGWLRAPVEVCKAVELVKQGADLCGSALTQRIAAELLADTVWLESHLDVVRAAYRDRAGVLADALADQFGDAAAITQVGGGMFCWVDFTDGTDTDALLPAALDAGVAFVPGSAFAESGYRSSMRVCFTTGSAEVLRDAAVRLGAARAGSMA